MDLTPIAAVLGLISGTIGTVLGILNHLRDNPRVEVTLTWGLEKLNENTGNKYVVVSVANIGRRPIFISHVHLIFPELKYMGLLPESVQGNKINEGDAPSQFYGQQSDLKSHGIDSKVFPRMRAVVTDSAGKLYCSRLADEYSRVGRIRHWYRCRKRKVYKS